MHGSKYCKAIWQIDPFSIHNLFFFKIYLTLLKTELSVEWYTYMTRLNLPFKCHSLKKQSITALFSLMHFPLYQIINYACTYVHPKSNSHCLKKWRPNYV